jgi:hypothetical protein
MTLWASTARLFARLLRRFFLLPFDQPPRISVDSHNRKESRSCRHGEYYVTAFGWPMRKSVTAVDLLLLSFRFRSRGQCSPAPPIAFVRRNPPHVRPFLLLWFSSFDCLMDQEKNPLGHFFFLVFGYFVWFLAEENWPRFHLTHPAKIVGEKARWMRPAGCRRKNEWYVAERIFLDFRSTTCSQWLCP